MEEKLTRPQETASERQQSKKKIYSDESMTNIAYAYAVRNCTIKPQRNLKRRKNNNTSNFSLTPVKKNSGFSTNTQSTGQQGDAEKNQTFLTTAHQNFPLTTRSVSAKLWNVGNCENETSSQSKSTLYQQHAKCVPGDGCCSIPRVPAPYDGLIGKACRTYCESVSNSTQTLQFKCRVCAKELHGYRVRNHFVALHPEVFFADVKSQLSMRQAAHFSESCKNVLQTEMYWRKQLMLESEQKGYEKKSEKAVWCIYCNVEKCGAQLKLHLFRYHHNKLEDNLKNYLRTGVPENVPNTKSTIRTELDQNLEPGHKSNFRFAYSVGGDLGKAIASSNISGQTCSAVVNMKSDVSQNLEYENTKEYGWQGFATKHKSNTTNYLVEGTSSSWYTTEASTNEGKYAEDFHYGNVSDQYFAAWLNDQDAGLATGSNMRINDIIPNVSSNLSSTTFPNHFSQTGISSIPKSSCNVGTAVTNQIKQYYPTIMTPANSHWVHLPVSVHEQHQVESNLQEILPSNACQTYSVHPSAGTGIINDVPEWNEDFHIATEYLLENNFIA